MLRLLEVSAVDVAAAAVPVEDIFGVADDSTRLKRLVYILSFHIHL